MESRAIRELFLSFFEERAHKRVPSSSLISPDPSLLLTTAGMVQFIPYFLGQAEPPYLRTTNVQKAFRTTDIENVGHTARHCTFFEMLGNFSFGDYFKSEAIGWAWELVTEGYGIDPDLIWVTAYQTDDEAIDIWADQVGIPRDRIVRRGKEDNFWWTHAAGPGGPCSEIYVDRGPKYGPEGGPAVDEERFLEIWNLVFMQNEVDDAGEVVADLPKKNIDTGSSLERVAMALQRADSIFDTDLFRPLVAVVEELSGRRYGADDQADTSLRIVAEHGRATSFLVADGVLPGNVGRGYVLRRMLRRMVTHARRLGIERPFTDRLVEQTITIMADAYPELVENKAFILQVAASEEERFGRTLQHGLAVLDAVDPSEAGDIPGAVAFKLHDTFGFPIELTRELAEERGLGLDMAAFESLMQEQVARARAARSGGREDKAVASIAARAGRTEFVGYERLEEDAEVVGLLADGAEAETAHEGQDVRLFVHRTPFYAEGGGQVGDRGVIRTSGGVVRVTDAKPAPGGVIVHVGTVESGEIRVGDAAHALVDPEAREATARAHTATHVVHWTLRHVLGEHARQAGSLVEPGRFRFDFTHPSGVASDVLEEAEYIANAQLAADDPVRAFETTLAEAKRMGAIALFEEAYGDLVRVVEVGDYSRELCGGTHVPHTGKVAVVRLLGEAGIGSGLRRIEALVGPDAIRQINLERRLLVEVASALGAGDPTTAPDRARRAIERIKQLESELGKVRKGAREEVVRSLADSAANVDGVALVVSEVPGEDADGLRELALALRSKLERSGPGAAVLGNADADRALLVAAVTGALVERGITATRLLEHAAATIGGGAGGKPILAFAGGKNAAALGEALDGIQARLTELASLA
jgi:alanyl-tRNA synthetase